jgi:glycosyltransferase involved in cell wall biosynthesis
LTILEAQAAGVPVVASTIPGVLEVVEHGRTGFTIPAGDVQGYAEALATLHANEALRTGMAEAAAAQVRREHSWATYERRMFDIYKSVHPAFSG